MEKQIHAEEMILTYKCGHVRSFNLLYRTEEEKKSKLNYFTKVLSCMDCRCKPGTRRQVN